MWRKNFTMVVSSSASMRSKSRMSLNAARHWLSGTSPSTRSSSRRMYQLWSKIAISPWSGTRSQKRHSQGRLSSNDLGSPMLCSLKPRGSRRCVTVAMDPPLPAASQPSNTKTDLIFSSQQTFSRS